MQSVTLCDTVTIENDNAISVSCSNAQLCGESNLAYKAAERFFKATGVSGGALIKIEKRIPVAAGLAGGSADAAAVLVGLDELYKTNLGREKLCKTGLTLGADIPFCIMGGTKLAKGIGEELTNLPPMPDCYIVIAKEGEKTSTGDLYAKYDNLGVKKHPDTPKMLLALKNGNPQNICAELCNVFEELSQQSQTLKRKMLEHGAVGACLSGSGPSVFGIFSDEKSAELCAKAINGTVCKPVQNVCCFL